MTRASNLSLVFAVLALGAGVALAQDAAKKAPEAASTPEAGKAADATKAPDGKALFLDAKCNTCHSISAIGIEKKKATGPEAEQAAKADKDEKKPPDLSSVGLDKKADWIAKFLTKKETLEGEKHKKLYKGTDDQLKTLSAWLESQKAPKKKGK